jgi:hypothetical protein
MIIEIVIVKNTITGVFVMYVEINSVDSLVFVSDTTCKIKGVNRVLTKKITYNSNVVINHKPKTSIIPIYFFIGSLKKVKITHNRYEYVILYPILYTK